MPAASQTIQRGPNLARQVYEVLCQRLADGRLRPGERLALERLAEQLGVSPTPVREAAARLLRDGLLVEVGARLQVVALTPQYVTNTFLVRGALDGLAAELATPRISQATLLALQSTLDETGAALAQGDTQRYRQSDTELHQAIEAAAGNEVLLDRIAALQVHVDLIRGYSQRHAGDHLRRSHAEHVQILAALLRQDALAARHQMEQHIRQASARIIQLIDFA